MKVEEFNEFIGQLFPDCKTWGDVAAKIDLQSYMKPFTQEETDGLIASVKEADARLAAKFGTPFPYIENVISWIEILTLEKEDSGARDFFKQALLSIAAMFRHYTRLATDDDTIGSPDMLRDDWKLP